jgi:hypothetical protein
MTIFDAIVSQRSRGVPDETVINAQLFQFGGNR